MPARYNALLAKIRDWSNRDTDTLPDSIIADAVRYAEDHAYRNLRIPPLEATITYSIPENAELITDPKRQSLRIPTDLSEFISLRQLNAPEGAGSQPIGENRTRVFNQKADYRTFTDYTAIEYDFYRWTRRGNEILMHPPYRAGDTYELFYYRRLPALWALYDVTPANWQNNRLDWFEMPITTDMTTTPQDERTTQLFFPTGTPTGVAPTPSTEITPTLAATMANTVALNFRGKESPNWLRDDQEKLLIWGAMTFIGSYLGDDEMQQKYLQMFTQEITELNDEEGKRRVSGVTS